MNDSGKKKKNARIGAECWKVFGLNEKNKATLKMGIVLNKFPETKFCSFENKLQSPITHPIISQSENLKKKHFNIEKMTTENKIINKPIEFHTMEGKSSKLLTTKFSGTKLRMQSGISETGSQVFEPGYLISKFLFYES